MTLARPLGSTGVTPLPSLLRADPTPAGARGPVMSFRPSPWGTTPASTGLSGSLSQSFDTRRPSRPRGARWLLIPAASPSALGFITSDSLATPNWRNEANYGFTCVTARIFAASGAWRESVATSHPRAASCQTGHYMANSFQFAGPTGYTDAPEFAENKANATFSPRPPITLLNPPDF